MRDARCFVVPVNAIKILSRKLPQINRGLGARATRTHGSPTRYLFIDLEPARRTGVCPPRVKIRRSLMNWDRIEGNWKQFKGKVREKWGDLSDSDLERINGRRDQFEGVLQERYGIGRDVAKKNIDEWLKTLH
jgi:uncharacterized protein YjbJ (UPF0337 family)